MGEVKKTCDSVVQNLEDAGCTDCIDRFLELYKDENLDGQLRLLNKERRKILDCVHESQKRLDCLDYLIYSLKQRKKGGRLK